MRNVALTKKAAIILKAVTFPSHKAKMTGTIDVWWVVNILFPLTGLTLLCIIHSWYLLFNTSTRREPTMIYRNPLLCSIHEREHGIASKYKHKNCYNGLVDTETVSPYCIISQTGAY